ncbi:MAG TPA: hypothetical protein VL443_24345 [Cyclobacteriaceae bacterium]|jgi:hypothetical protein|nr:hypothetical protein [Cyclobacteriaceae bacterium]
MSKKAKTPAAPLPTMDEMQKNFMEEESGKDSTGDLNTEEEEEEEEETEREPEPEKKGPHLTREARPGKARGGKEIEGSSVRVYREDNKFMKRRPTQLQGLSSQMLPPITKKKLAMYEVIGKNEVDPLTRERIVSPTLILPGKYIIYDPFGEDVLKRHILLRNVTRTETVVRDGREVPEETTEDLIFPDGFKSVAIERNYLEYVLLELHPLNESNKFRDRSQAPAFKRIDLGYRKDWAETTAGMDLAFEAEKIVVGMRNGDEIITYATAAGIPTAGRMIDSGDTSVKMDLRRFARQSPRDFFKLNKHNTMAIKMAVLEAIDLGLIEYFVDRRDWLFSTDGGSLGQHLPGQDPTETLIKLLQREEYQEVYAKLQNQLNYWE